MAVSSMLAVVLKPSKIRYDATRSLSKTKRIQASLTAIFSISLALILFFGIQFGAIVWTSKNKVYAYEQSFVITPAIRVNGAVVSTQNLDAVDSAEIQSVLSTWAKKYVGKASVVITETATGKQLAASDASKIYYTASIYKLYVAYLGSQDIDSGIHSAADPFLNGNTRADCITKMIQLSDSPCAEKMLNEMGKKVANSRLVEIGLKGTAMNQFTTTALDAAIVTRKIALGEDLSSQSARRLQEAMSAQVYRDALPKGFKNSKVANKVGFYEVGYHDSANVTPISGRTFTVSVLSENMGTRQIAELAKSLEPVLAKL